MIDTEDWNIAFEAYSEHPLAAYTLAQYLTIIKESLQSEPKSIPEAIAALDNAVDCLYEHSHFRKVSYEFFRQAIEGKITTQQEEVIRRQGCLNQRAVKVASNIPNRALPGPVELMQRESR
jgi:hypothetical protein